MILRFAQDDIVWIAANPTTNMPDRTWQPAGPPTLPPPRGAYSRVIRAGELIFVSGQVPRDLETGELLGEDIASQTRAVFRNLETILHGCGASLADVVSITAWLADINEWDSFDAVYREMLRPPYPTRTTVGAGLHGVLVEITAIAVAPHREQI